MSKEISPKITALTFGILTFVLLAAFYVIAWQEPTSAPPGGNVPSPINVGTDPQAKAGRISATEFYDYNNPNYYLNPSGQSSLSALCFGADCRSSWPAAAAIPSGMIAMFDTSCPSGWTRFAALDNRFPQGAATYGGTGGSSSITLNVEQLPPHSHELRIGGGGFWVGCEMGNVQERTGWCYVGGRYTRPTGSGSAINILNPYLNVVWCKKD